MKNLQKNLALKTIFVLLCFTAANEVFAQRATYSVPLSVGTANCSSGSAEIHYYHYNSESNLLTDLAGDCQPRLRRGNSNFTFTSNLASVSYNPKDQHIYYLYTQLGSGLRTWIWRWPVGTCPTANSTASRPDTIRSFAYDILGVTFDRDGTGYMIEFSTGSAPYTIFLRSIDFVTGTYGQADTLELTGGFPITNTGTGDIAISPSGQMYFTVDNKLFTPDYKSYGGPSKKITATYLGPVVPPSASSYLVGLTFSDGQLIASYSGGGCNYREMNPITGEWTTISRAGGSQSTSDFASVISGIGASKQLVSYTPTGVPNQYNVVYDIYIKNFGNYPLTNVQVNDTLSRINGASNFVLNSVSFMENPAGLQLNTGYNGSTNTALLTGTIPLPNFPAENNYARIRISVRLSNIMPGIVYFNQAWARARGYTGASLLDASTNGTSPDLNSNDRPDDPGENQPTPLLLAVAGHSDPCTQLSTVLYNQSFGSGPTQTNFSGGNSPSSGYPASTSIPLSTNTRIIASNPADRNPANWRAMGDHTNGSGRMLMVNADAANSIFYADNINGLCANQQYSLFFWAAFPGNNAYSTVCDAFGGFRYPKVLMRIKDAVTGAVITQMSSPEITSSTWNQYGVKFVLPAGFSNVVFELINDAAGGCGNDILIDDIQFGLCNPIPTVAVNASSAGCMGSPASFDGVLSDEGVIPGTKVYQWQRSTDSVNWTNIAGATNANYTIPSVNASHTNVFYRVMVAANGNMSNANCRFVSPGYRLTAKTASVAASSVSASRTAPVCPGTSVTLTRNGGSLGTNAVWNWYSGSCGGTLIGSGNSVNVSPALTTTYYLRADGDCNSTSCVAITVTVACDIDKDDDGIPDTVEHNGIDPFEDDDSDGIPNYRDANYPGFIDTNGDGVNDNFDWDLDGIINALDLDSDNDGIPDVVEAGGVDANGDGRIDNYADSDGDGFSDNVDGNLFGHTGSGTGLGLPDFDGDGIPNMFDLDSDNDGIPDIIEAGGVDANNDGKVDGFADADSDGLSDQYDGDRNNDGIAESAPSALIRTGSDNNGDGRADSYPYANFDRDRLPNPYDLDSDNDGITDLREAGFSDADGNGLSDGARGADGWSIAINARASLGLRHSDGDTNPDYLDIDSDNDGIPDNVEAMATSSYRMPLNIDSDGDGIDDRYDNINGPGGSGATPNDQDGDGIPDYIDTDSDNDGALDIIEGNDFNGNCLRDDGVVLTGIDTDGDGLDDLFDLDNSSTRGTTGAMGNFGGFSGDPSPGSRAAVGQCVMGAPDRDWRYQPFALEADFLRASARAGDHQISIEWTFSAEKLIDYFEILASEDGKNFIPLTSVTAPRELLSGRDFKALIKRSATTKTYYQIKAVSLDKHFKTSPTLQVLAPQTVDLTIGPNPASRLLDITAYLSGATLIDARILDMNGRVVVHKQFLASSGSNRFTVEGLEKLSNGFYQLTLRMGNEIKTFKFIIRH